MSEDPTDLLVLTPGHFLRGAPLMAIPEPSAETLSLANRWQKLKILHQEFSRRWKAEYLHELHRRHKWRQPQKDIEEGDLVVIKDDLLPPQEWCLGRVLNLHRGSDNHIRVADVRTQAGVYTRPIVKLCPLPSPLTVSSN